MACKGGCCYPGHEMNAWHNTGSIIIRNDAGAIPVRVVRFRLRHIQSSRLDLYQKCPSETFDCLICAIFARRRFRRRQCDEKESCLARCVPAAPGLPGGWFATPQPEPLSRKLGAHKPVKTKFWPWLEPFSVRTSSSHLGRSIVARTWHSTRERASLADVLLGDGRRVQGSFAHKKQPPPWDRHRTLDMVLL